MIENKLLYSSYNQAMSKFITDGPFTTDFSKESPAKIGSWIGWQIVRSYMNHNRKVMFTGFVIRFGCSENTYGIKIPTRKQVKYCILI